MLPRRLAPILFSLLLSGMMSMLATLVLISPEMKYFSRRGASRSRNVCPLRDMSSRISSAGMKPLSAK